MKRFAAAVVSLAVRAVPPLVILAVGYWGYSKLVVEPEGEPPEPAKPRVLASRVAALNAGEYVATIESNGIVGPHNAVTLSAEVTGNVVEVTADLEVGSFFETGDLLVRIDDRDYRNALRVAEENLRLAKSNLKLAAVAHQRMIQLVDRNSGSDTELDTTMTALVAARSQQEIADAAVEQAERNLDRCRVVAPFDGRVVARSVGPGQAVSPGAVLGNIFSVDYAEVRLPIAGRDLRFIDLPEMEGDRPVDIELRDAIDLNSPRRWKARIVRTEGSLDPSSLELFAIARIDDPFALRSDHPTLRIGQPVVASIPGRTLDDVVAVPRSAVRRLDQVYLVDGSDKRLRRTTITPVWSDAENLIVPASTFRDGELLATTALVYAPEGTVVTILPDEDVTKNLAGEPEGKTIP